MRDVPTIWFDVEDLLHHFRSGSRRPSGIQRLSFEIYRAAQAAYGVAGDVQFVAHGSKSFVTTDWEWLVSEWRHAETVVPRELQTVPVQERKYDDYGTLLSGDTRRHLVCATRMQMRALTAVGRLGIAASLHVARSGRDTAVRIARRATDPRRSRRLPASIEAPVRPGDVLLVLGSPWFRQDYARLVRWARDTRRMRFGVLVHDMVPINSPEWCDLGIVTAYRTWSESVLPLCDFVLSNSGHTAREVENWAARRGLRLASPVRPIPIGSGFGERGHEVARTPRLPRAGTYVLFVSTLEARKNHALLVRVWRLLLEEEERGLRSPGSVPELVFAGRVGWLVGDLMQQLENASWLGGRVRLLQDPSDAELRALYEDCLFTIFPSLYEGWGLPVTEALALGAPVLCSSAAALPEAGGSLARYFNPNDAGGCRRAVAALLDHPEDLAAWRTEVRNLFRPTPWSETAEKVVETARSLA